MGRMEGARRLLRNYRLDRKALGRALSGEETLAEAALPEDDRLVLSPVVVAGGTT